MRRGRLPLHQRTVARKHEDLRDFCRFVGVLPDPGTTGVAGAKGIFHRGAQGCSVDGFAGLEQGDEGSRSLDQVVGEARDFRAGGGLGHGRKLDGMGVSVHRQSPGLRVGPKPRAHSLTREGSPLPPCLSLFHGIADFRSDSGNLSSETGDGSVGAVAEVLVGLTYYQLARVLGGLAPAHPKRVRRRPIGGRTHPDSLQEAL